MITLADFASLFLFYSLISQALERTLITPPIRFTLAGILPSLTAPSIRDAWVNADILFRLAEVGLVLLLFADASRTNLQMLAHNGGVPARLLTVSMLLMILLGAVIARMLFPILTIWECGSLATVLVLLSIFAHGLSAAPGIKLYTRRTTPSDSVSAVSPSG
jgi:NhaP-type Na+/H+ or K+/H+ antiporter